MKLLQLAHRLPWPLIDGGKKGTYGFFEGYRRHSSVTQHKLCCMCPKAESAWASEWGSKEAGIRVDLMDARNSVVKVLANTLFSKKPFNMEKYQRAGFGRMLRAELAQNLPDVVHFDSLHTASYAAIVRQDAPRALRVLRCHNAEHVILKRLAESKENSIKRMLIDIQADRLCAYEAAALDEFDLILAITEDDARRFRHINPGIDDKMIVVPAGANIPSEVPVAPPNDLQCLRLIHIAAMDWIPNQDALRWLLVNVLPILDRIGVGYRLDVVGKSMPTEFIRWKQKNVVIHGFIEDVKPLMAQAHLAVVPLQTGGGMRVKILDYWAMGIPVLSTHIGAEGLWQGAETVVALADAPEEFAATIARLSGHPEERETLRMAAFRKVSAHYGWPSIIDRLVMQYQGMLK